MDDHQQARLIELLSADADPIFAQGVELLRSSGADPHARFVLARMLRATPHRAFAVMTNDDDAFNDAMRQYGLRCLERLTALEHRQRKHPLPDTFTALLDAALRGAPLASLRARCEATVATLNHDQRAGASPTADPERFIRLRAQQVLLRVLDGDEILTQIRQMVRTFSRLEPRGLLHREKHVREKLCYAAQDDVLLSLLNAQPSQRTSPND